MAFYCGAYFMVAFLPSKFAAFQVGFSLGYGIAMCGGVIFLALTQSIGFPTGPPAAPWVFGFAILSNVGLAALALGSWKATRRQLNGWTSVRSCIAGITYPVVVFFVTIILALPFGR